jgi:hypothetical protein
MRSKTMSNKVKDTAEEADELAYDALCSLEELHDLLVEIEDATDEDVPTKEARAALRAVEALQEATGALVIFVSEHPDDEGEDDEDEDESTSAPEPASP